MQKSVMVRFVIAILLPVVSVAAGYKLHNPIEAHTNQFNGLWQGQSVITLHNTLIDSYATIIVDEDNVRISINNQLGENNYTYDASLKLHVVDAEYVRLEVLDREITGLDAFQERTGIRIPASGTLLELYGWRLEQGKIFFHIQVQGSDSLSYIFHKAR